VIGLAMGVVGHFLMGAASRGWMMLAFIAPLSLGGLAGPSVQAIISREVGASEQGELQGALNSLNGVAAIAGPLIGTTLLARFGPQAAVPHVAGAAFFAGAAFNALGLGLALRLLYRHRARPAAA
jgi:DHA1 family tetracycline resistance protein-like MFS transporter